MSQDDDVVDRLQTATDGMRHMAMLIRRWMDHGGATAQVHDASMTLGESIDRAVKLIEPTARLRKVVINVEVADAAAGLPAGSVSPVIANALRNSIHAIDVVPEGCVDMPDHLNGHITISAQVHGDRVELTVTDDGHGIDSQMIDEAGDVSFGKTTRPDGHGLGLALCHEIAKTMGGSLVLENRSPRGAVLKLSYPLPPSSKKYS